MMQFDESFVAAIAFVLFILLSYRKIASALSKMLDLRILKVEKELADALKLREDAQAMLSEYEKKYRSIEKESEDIIRQAHEKVEAMRHSAEVELKMAIEMRLKAANSKIQKAEELAIQDVQRQVVDIALMAARQLIAEKMKSEADDQLINIAMQDVAKIIH
jgi:F-type H+-transporting ATPase subunit b